MALGLGAVKNQRAARTDPHGASSGPSCASFSGRDYHARGMVFTLTGRASLGREQSENRGDGTTGGVTDGRSPLFFERVRFGFDAFDELVEPERGWFEFSDRGDIGLSGHGQAGHLVDGIDE